MQKQEKQDWNINVNGERKTGNMLMNILRNGVLRTKKRSSNTISPIGNVKPVWDDPMGVLDEFKSKLPDEIKPAACGMLNLLGKYDILRIEDYLKTGAEVPMIVTKRLDYALSDAGYPNLTWKRVIKSYENMGKEHYIDFD